jgi:hypothetical protein
MARDKNLILHDGTTFTSTITPNSTTRSGGSAVLDIGKTGAEGLWVQMAENTVIAGSSPTVDIKLQASSSATFASDIEDLGAFQQVSGTGAIQRVEKKIVTKRRYLRAVITVGGTLTTGSIFYIHIVSGPNRDSVS